MADNVQVTFGGRQLTAMLVASGGGADAGQVQGNVASGATDSGNPVSVAGTYQTTAPTFTSGQRTVLLTNSAGSLVTTFGGRTTTATDGLSNANIVFPVSSTGGASQDTPRTAFAVSGYVFNGASWDRERGDAVSAFSRPAPRPKSASAVTAGSTTSQQLFAANTTRSRVLIQNQDAAINVFVNVGATAVAGAGNLRIAPGGTLELTGTSEAVNLIAASGTPAICAWEF